MNADPCLDENHALAFVAGRLPPTARAVVEGHVDSCASCRALIALALQASGPTVAAPTGDRFRPGTRIGRYVVRERIGRGAMGVIYRADDLELDRPVALKRLSSPAATGPGGTARLIREARAAAQLSHPNVVTVYEVGDAGGEPFIAMELIDGISVSAWRRTGRRSWREIVDVFAQAGRGLTAAHTRGVVHRDFKPDNMMIDASGRVRVADFGLARTIEDAGAAPTEPTGMTPTSALSRLTATGAVVGTPAYLAPEIGGGAAPDAGTDQYSFAVSLYETLHGRLPFPGRTAEAIWLAATAGGLPLGADHVPRWLDARVVRGLAADPAERWPSVDAMVAAITRPPRRWVIAAALAGLATIAIALVIGRALAAAPPDPCATAGAELDAAWSTERRAQLATALEGDPDRAAASLAALDSYATAWRAGARAACSTHPAQTADLGDRRQACLDRARQRFAAVVADTAGAPGRLPAAVEELPAIDQCADADALLARVAPPSNAQARDQVAAAERALARADAARDAGRLADAEAALVEALALGEQAHYPVIVSRVALARVELALDRGEPAVAAQLALDALTIASAAGDREASLDAQLAMLRARADADPRTVDRLARPMVAAAEADPGSVHAARLQSAYGYALLAVGRYADAETAYRKAQAILDRILPEGHHARARAAFDVGAALVLQHHSADALAVLSVACPALARTLSRYRRENIECENSLGLVYGQLGRPDDAIAHHRAALAGREQVFGPESPGAAISLFGLAGALEDAGRIDEAIEMYQRVVTIRVTALGARSPDVALARINLAAALEHAGRFSAAAAELDRALPVTIADVGADHVNVAIARYHRVKIGLAEIRGGHPATGAYAYAALVAQLDQVEAGFVAAFGADGQPLLNTAALRADLEAWRGHRRAALVSLERARRIAVATGAGDDDLAEIARVRARIH